VQEAEAELFGAAMLVPRESALEWMRQNGDLEDGARNLGVSIELFRGRVNHTGLVRQVARSSDQRGIEDRAPVGERQEVSCASNDGEVRVGDALRIPTAVLGADPVGFAVPEPHGPLYLVEPGHRTRMHR
jgi:hypothetical protein